ncbi:MAG: hypothetical protein BGN94_04125 [Rhizobiales bacterium 68-8]|nr:MAG: hypothetical protein BGN94_04125 [Rhizobiales bacterium 68-8]
MISASKPSASSRNTRLVGRVTNTLQSPRERSSVRRRFSSNSGPRMKPRISGAGSQPILAKP